MERVIPKPAGRFVRSGLALGLGLTILAAGCKKPEEALPPAPPPAVTVAAVNPRDIPVEFEYVAQTQSSHQVNIQARINGFLDKHLYTEGALVKTGEVLFLMDEKPFVAQLAQAEAALAQQKAAYNIAELDLKRTKTLAKEKVVAQKDLDDAVAQYQSTQAAVQQAMAQVQTARLNLSYTKIASPVTGVSSAARQTDGSYINPQNSLLTVVTVLSPMWVNFSLSENEMLRYRDQVAKGLIHPPKDGRYDVEIVLVDGSIFPFQGHITFAEPSYSIQTGTFLIRTSVENPDGLLRPNQFVHVRLKGAIRPKAILVPQRSVQEGSKGQFVWVVGEGRKVEQRPVVVGTWHGDDWFIFEGLHGGEQVVVDGNLSLQPGLTVAIKTPGKAVPLESAGSKKTAMGV